MKAEEEILKFKTGERVIFQENFFDIRCLQSKRTKAIIKTITKNCSDVEKAFWLSDGCYNLRITGIKK